MPENKPGSLGVIAMLKKLLNAYLNKVGQETAVLHAVSAAVAGVVSPVLALGLLTGSRKSAMLTVPTAVAFAGWYCYRALPFSDDAAYAAGALFYPTSPLIVALSAFGAGLLFRWVMDGGLSKRAALITGAIAVIILTQGRGGLEEIEARDVLVTSTGVAGADSLMRVYTHINEIQKEKGVNSPEALAANYVFFKEISKDIGLVGVPDYRSYLIYREQKRQDAELLKIMSPMGRTDEWVKIVEKRQEDPSWPDNFLKP
jgi:hypothetical protein